MYVYRRWSVPIASTKHGHCSGRLRSPFLVNRRFGTQTARNSRSLLPPHPFTREVGWGTEPAIIGQTTEKRPRLTRSVTTTTTTGDHYEWRYVIRILVFRSNEISTQNILYIHPILKFAFDVSPSLLIRHRFWRSTTNHDQSPPSPRKHNNIIIRA